MAHHSPPTSSPRTTIDCPPFLRDVNIKVNPDVNVPELLRRAMDKLPGGLDSLESILCETDCVLASERCITRAASIADLDKASFVCHKLQLFAAIWKIHQDDPPYEELTKRQKKLSHKIVATFRTDHERSRTMRLVLLTATMLYHHSSLLLSYLDELPFHFDTLGQIGAKHVNPVLAGALLTQLMKRASSGDGNVTAPYALNEFKSLQLHCDKAAESNAHVTADIVVAAADAAVAASSPSSSAPSSRQPSSSSTHLNREAKARSPSERMKERAATMRRTALAMRFTSPVVRVLSEYDQEVIVAALMQTSAIAEDTLYQTLRRLPHIARLAETERQTTRHLCRVVLHDLRLPENALIAQTLTEALATHTMFRCPMDVVIHFDDWLTKWENRLGDRNSDQGRRMRGWVEALGELVGWKDSDEESTSRKKKPTKRTKRTKRTKQEVKGQHEEEEEEVKGQHEEEQEVKGQHEEEEEVKGQHEEEEEEVKGQHEEDQRVEDHGPHRLSLPVSFSAEVIDTKGDGNCLLYALLRLVNEDETPTAANELRAKLRAELLRRYKRTDKWEARVPPLVQDVRAGNVPLTPEEYATKFLTKNYTDLPSSVVCIWQDLNRHVQVYVLVRDHSATNPSFIVFDRVETFKSPDQPPTSVGVLYRQMNGRGHYGVVSVGIFPAFIPKSSARHVHRLTGSS